MRLFNLMGAAMVVGGVVAGTPAAAVQPVTLTSVGIYNPGHVTVTTGGNVVSEYSVPLTFTAKSTKPAAFDALGFCVDLAHNIYVGLGSQLQTSLSYHVVQLTTDGSGHALSKHQATEIAGLATLGFAIAKSDDADKPARLAAIQQAIWTVEYPASTFAATGDFATAQAGYAAQYLAEAGKLRGYARSIVSDNGTTQAFVTNIAGVPEPTTWVELVTGFGLIGAFARRRSTQVAVAA